MSRQCPNRTADLQRRQRVCPVRGHSQTTTEPKAPQPAPKSEASNPSHPAPKAAAESTSKEKLETPQKKQQVDVADALHSLLSAFLGSAQARTPSKKGDPSPSSHLSSLKDQLEARLYNDPDVEVRDTIQALMASVFSSRPSSTPTPAPTPASPKGDSEAPKGKGKAKTVSFDIPAPAQTSNELAHALDTVRNIEASFFALESDFVLPKTLDLSADVLAKFSNADADSDSETSSLSLDSKLAYTARNAPVRYYEHALSALLAQLDAVESYGNEEVRVRRKEVVARVEKALEEVEREVEVRLGKAEKPKESASDVLPAQPVEAPADTSVQLPSAAESNAADAVAPLVVTTEEEENQDVALARVAEAAALSDDVSTVANTPEATVSEEGRVTGSDSRQEAGLAVDGEEVSVDTPLSLDGQEASQLISETDSAETAIRSPSPNTIAESDDSAATILPSSISEPSEPATIDTFLLPAELPSLSETAYTPSPLDSDEAVVVDEKNEPGSDEDTWSEVEA
jgi:hypothetical protein